MSATTLEAVTSQLNKNPLLRTKGFCNGQWYPAYDNKTFPVLDPATGKTLAEIPDMGKTETEKTIAAAFSAWHNWRQLTGNERSQYLKKWHALILKNEDHLAEILTFEQGKPLAESLGEIRFGAAFVEWFAEEAKRIGGDSYINAVAGKKHIVIKQPVGVVGAITPWNFPSAMVTRKCAPALAAGCTLVLKPAEDTPLSALALAALAEQAGFPHGVINVITTNQAAVVGETLTQNPLVRKISFTGSTKVGKLLMQQSADTVKKISLELGGNSPFIVFADADVDQAVKSALEGKFRNNGQTCVCPNRFYIHDKVYAEFTDKLKTGMQTLKLGHGAQENITAGPLINSAAAQKVKALVNDAIEKGADCLLGGKPSPIGANYFEPTLLTNVSDAMALSCNEIFGPVAALFRFNDEQDVLKKANDTPFGLASYFFTRDAKRVWKMAEYLETGIVSVNTTQFGSDIAPFGGYKESGIGREGSKYGIEEFLEIKSIAWDIS